MSSERPSAAHVRATRLVRMVEHLPPEEQADVAEGVMRTLGKGRALLTSPTVGPATRLAPPNPYADALASLRSTAQWLVTAFAAVGGILVTGVPLTGLGALDWPELDFILAVAGALLALASIGWLISGVTQVLTRPYANLSDLAAEEPDHPDFDMTPLVKEVEVNRDELFGAYAKDLPQLYGQLQKLNESVYTQPMRTSQKRHRAEVQSAVALVVDFANYEAARRTMQRFYRKMMIGGAVVALGVGVFAYLTGRSFEPPIDQPIPVFVSLSEEGTDRFSSSLGKGCTLEGFEAVAVAGTLDEPKVATSGEQGCAPTEFEVTDAMGVATPIYANESPSS